MFFVQLRLYVPYFLFPFSQFKKEELYLPFRCYQPGYKAEIAILLIKYASDAAFNVRVIVQSTGVFSGCVLSFLCD